jgi:hypothetical protein
MKTYLTFGLFLALAGSLINFVIFFLGYHNDIDRMQAGQYIGGAASFVVTIALVALGIRATREASADRSLSYGRGVLAGLMIGVFSGLFGAVLVYVYGRIINPEYHDLLYELQIDKMAEKGMPASNIESAEGVLRFFSGPLFTAAMTVLFSPVVTIVIALIAAIFLKRAPAAAQPPAMPAA